MQAMQSDLELADVLDTLAEFSPARLETAPTTDPSSCNAFGSGLSVASTASAAYFTVQCRDEWGMNKSFGGDRLYLQLTDPRTGSPAMVSEPSGEEHQTDYAVVDLGTGQYVVTYTPPAPGTFDMLVQVSPVQAHLAQPYLQPVSIVGFPTPLVVSADVPARENEPFLQSFAGAVQTF